MLPDAKGTLFNIPASGETTELDLDFIPDQQFLNLVNMDSLRIVAFIQDDDSKEVFQSEMTDVTFSNNINASFKSDETLGGLPLTVNFEDFSTPTDSTTITSWAWDFDNDGNIDSQDENPSWTYTTEGAYTVSLTVSDGVNQYTRTLENYIHAIGTSSDILVVNGIEYVTYPTEMENFYSSSAVLEIIRLMYGIYLVTRVLIICRIPTFRKSIYSIILFRIQYCRNIKR
jgi:hypothetical protein